MSKNAKGMTAGPESTGTNMIAQPDYMPVTQPDYMPVTQNHVANTTEKDILRPYIQLGQYMSDAVKEGDVKAGHFYNNITLEDLGTEITVLVLAAVKGRGMLDKSGKKLLCVSRDCKIGKGEPGGNCESCPKAAWPEATSERRRPECSEVGRMLVMLPGQPKSLSVMSLKSTSYKLFRNLVSQWQSSTAPIYGHPVTFTAFEDSNGDTDYFNIDANISKEFTPKEQFLEAQSIAQAASAAFVQEEEKGEA